MINTSANTSTREIYNHVNASSVAGAATGITNAVVAADVTDGPTTDTSVLCGMTSAGRPRDDTGAMYYIVVVLLVYSLGIVAFVAGHIYRRTQVNIEDEVSDFLVARGAANLDRKANIQRIQQTVKRVPERYWRTSESSVENDGIDPVQLTWPLRQK